TAFFAINSPPGNIPIFLSLTKAADGKTKKKISRKATFTAFIIVTGFIILGKYIFDLFGITIPAFKITGGILIFFVGFEMIRRSEEHTSELQSRENLVCRL